MLDQVQNNFMVYAAGFATFPVVYLIAKKALPLGWQGVKLLGYKAWELIKKLKFW